MALSWAFTQACSPAPAGEGNQETSQEIAQETTNQEKSQEIAKEPGQEPTAEKQPETAIPDEPAPVEVKPDGGGEPAPEPTGNETTPDASETTPETTPETPGEITPEQQASSVSVAYILNSDYTNGSFSVMTIADRKLRKEWTQVAATGDIAGDSAIRAFQSYVFLINRPTASIMVLDTANQFKPLATVTTGANTNPHDVAVLGTKMYVSLYDQSKIMVYEQNQAPITIDMSSLAEKSTKACTKDDDCTKFGAGSKKCDTTTGICQSDGIAELASLLVVGTKLYVAVQGLDRNDGYKPVKSALAVVDTTTNTLTGTLDLKGTNPVGIYKEPGGTYLIAETGSSLVPDDGGLERFDPNTGKMSGNYVITEKELGGDFAFPGGIAVVSSTLAYAVVNDASFKQSLVQFNPTTGKKIKDLITAKSLGSIALTSKGELLLAAKGDAQGNGRGIRIFDANTGNEITTQPISVSSTLPPASILVGELPQANVP